MTTQVEPRFYVKVNRFNTSIAVICDRSEKNDYNNDLCVSPDMPVELANELAADYNEGRQTPPILNSEESHAVALDHYNSQYNNKDYMTAIGQIKQISNRVKRSEAIDLLTDSAIELSFIELGMKPTKYYDGKTVALAKRIANTGSVLHMAVINHLTRFTSLENVLSKLFHSQIS